MKLWLVSIQAMQAYPSQESWRSGHIQVVVYMLSIANCTLKHCFISQAYDSIWLTDKMVAIDNLDSPTRSMTFGIGILQSCIRVRSFIHSCLTGTDCGDHSRKTQAEERLWVWSAMEGPALGQERMADSWYPWRDGLPKDAQWYRYQGGSQDGSCATSTHRSVKIQLILQVSKHGTLYVRSWHWAVNLGTFMIQSCQTETFAWDLIALNLIFKWPLYLQSELPCLNKHFDNVVD